ncbi:SDR family NAD(P)-dependent oxidoreductase [Streptomyces cinnamoneus]|uniref:SDR family NAD(P)-dependent oxidoreductase n=1 Tax=Streptomyces cinnamoneus TaxID=53446 RepID=UPI001EFD21BA|nr:SDR family NAD(P)-dependent oxidoreductase [Streptomyces cinnamoneus]
MPRSSHDGLTGRAALVTGSSRGLGLLIARELTRRGCRVMLCARDDDELARAERMLREEGADVRSLACDITDEQAPGRLVEATEAAFGSLDVLVNNAGEIQVGPLSAMAEADFRSAMETMYFAPLRLVMAALPAMRARGEGRIVTISSLGGRVAAPHLLPYAGAKFAAAGLSEGLRAELAADGISVTTVLPGLMRTGSHTAARFSGQPGREYAWFAAAADSRCCPWTPSGRPAPSSRPPSGAGRRPCSAPSPRRRCGSTASPPPPRPGSWPWAPGCCPAAGPRPSTTCPAASPPAGSTPPC